MHERPPTPAQVTATAGSGRHRRRVLSLAAVGALALAGSGSGPVAAAAGAAAAAAPAPAALAGTAPSWAVPAKVVGTASPARVLSLSVRLRTDTAGALAFARAVSEPGSAAQGRFLTPRQWTARFGATTEEAAPVVAFLQRQGFRDVVLNASRTAVAARGTVAAAQRAFGVTIRRYAVAESSASGAAGTAATGRILWGPDRAVVLPAGIAGAVSAVVGLAETPEEPASIPAIPSRGATVGAQARLRPQLTFPVYDAPCSDYYGQFEARGLPPAFGVTTLPTDICSGYVPKQLESAYGLSSLIRTGTTGRGVTVAIIGAYRMPQMASDLNRYSTEYGLATLRAGQYSENLPPADDTATYNECGGLQAWNREQATDVDTLHTAAPGANIVYVGGSNCTTGLTQAFDRLLAGNGAAPLASIVSNSYGGRSEDVPPAVRAATDLQAMQAAAEGVTVLFSSGNYGDNARFNNGVAEPGWPASSAWVTAVGGTAVGIGASGQRIFQTGWESSGNAVVQAPDGTRGWLFPLPGEFVAGSSGGTSAVVAEPAYQVGAVPDALSYARGNGTPGRVVPDISALADPSTSFRVAYSELLGSTGVRAWGEGGVGGTSVASPLTAGIIALAQQWSDRPFGFVNPALYALRSTRAIADVRAPDPNAYPSQQAVILGPRGFGETDLYGLDKASTLLTTQGYDDVTGLGSPNGVYFLTNLARLLK